MPEHCSCGTLLVENARFCHRCGKPVFDEPSPLDFTPAEEPTPLPSRAATATPPAIAFRNAVAVRVAFLMSVGIMLMEMIPGVNFLFIVWWLAAGWSGVRLYRRLTGFTLSVKEGARLGSLTGVFSFLSFTIVMALLMILNGREAFDQMVKANPQIAPVLNDPVQLSLGVLMFLCVVFGLIVGTCAAGGALGARYLGRANSSPVG